MQLLPFQGVTIRAYDLPVADRAGEERPVGPKAGMGMVWLWETERTPSPPQSSP